MKLTLAIAEKLQLLVQGEQLPASALQQAVVAEMLTEGIIEIRLAGRTRKAYFIPDVPAFANYLHNKHGIAFLEEYIRTLKQEETTRAGLIAVSNNSKTAATRVFKGFLVNSYVPVACTLNGQPFVVHPADGTFQFIHDFESFMPAEDVVIIGVENAEMFRHVAKLSGLLEGVKPLFISRYPQEQGKDVMRWLLSIPNQYLHMGDYDLAGINIYMHEYKRHLQERASFFIPDSIEQMLAKYGNAQLYDHQQLNNNVAIPEELMPLVALIHKYKKGLEQEALLL